MKKVLESKTVLLLLGCISLLGLMVLVASLSGLQFKPGAPFHYIRTSDTGSTPQNISPFPLFCGIAIVIASLVLLLIFIRPEQRKRLIRLVAVVLLTGAGLLWILSLTNAGQPLAQPEEVFGRSMTTASPVTTGTPEPEVGPAIFSPPEVTSWVSYAVTLGVLTAAGVGARWLLLRRHKRTELPSALASIAQSALDELSVEKDWGDTVINCYQRMTLAVEDWRGVRRRTGMTPGEFAEYLTGLGLPSEAVLDLTGLFEKVRYGRRKSTHKDIRTAVMCLNAIIVACKALG